MEAPPPAGAPVDIQMPMAEDPVVPIPGAAAEDPVVPIPTGTAADGEGEPSDGSRGVKGEMGAAMANPNVALEIAFGPPFPQLVPQQPNTGIQFARHCEREPKRLIFKKAHLSRDDFRIFDQKSGRLVAVSHHHGKNPYESLDPLNVGHDPNKHKLIGEMESMCNVTGTNTGFP